MKYFYLLILTILFNNIVFSQSWQREETTEAPLQLFSSVESLTLPTTETMSSGDIYFHISHKFITPISEGINELFGFDGSVNMRLALGYAPIDKLFLQLGRTNYEGNYDLQVKYRFLENNNESLPFALAINAGAAYNSKKVNEPADKSRLWQFYGNLVANAFIAKNLGFGIVPSYLYNANCQCVDPQSSFTLGLYTQYHFDERWSVIAEANPTLNGWRNYYDSYSLGVEIETAGHFFKLQLSNNIFINQTQFLGGAANKFESGDLHIGFVIQRVL